MPSMTGGDADCRLCEDDQRAAGTIGALHSSFTTCGDCGNKRCPRATYHGHACTGSNRPRQTGSSYGDVRCGDLDCRCVPAHAEAVAMRQQFEDVIRDASRIRAGATRELFDLLSHGCTTCVLCEDERRRNGDLSMGAPMTLSCVVCGFARCPHATYHGHPCTGSDAPGQTGAHPGHIRCGNVGCVCGPAMDRLAEAVEDWISSLATPDGR